MTAANDQMIPITRLFVSEKLTYHLNNFSVPKNKPGNPTAKFIQKFFFSNPLFYPFNLCTSQPAKTINITSPPTSGTSSESGYTLTRTILFL